VNPKTASSQILGGVVWGIGMALREETLIDHKFGRIVNANIAEYHVQRIALGADAIGTLDAIARVMRPFAMVEVTTLP
jgi:CO/xanthine dehydrogenase Mo-binding subunit